MSKPVCTTLTPREREIFQFYADGLTTKQIALRLRITVNVVQRHVTDVNQRHGTTHRAHALAVAMRNEWIR